MSAWDSKKDKKSSRVAAGEAIWANIVYGFGIAAPVFIGIDWYTDAYYRLTPSHVHAKLLSSDNQAESVSRTCITHNDHVALKPSRYNSAVECTRKVKAEIQMGRRCETGSIRFL